MGIYEVYVYDQAHESWFALFTTIPAQKRMEWTAVLSVPKPHGIYAGIGSVEIKECGLNAIAEIYK